jgi:hypothetical protein
VSRPSLTVDGGRPPAPAAEREHGEEELEHGAVQVPLPETTDEDPGWSYSTLKTLVSIPFMVAHVVASRQGPRDAWEPDAAELGVMVDPLYNMCQRYAVLRRLARFSDPIAFAAATGAYTKAESTRIARWRAEHGQGEPSIEPDAELDGLGVTATRLDDTTMRTWRPPNLPTES